MFTIMAIDNGVLFLWINDGHIRTRQEPNKWRQEEMGQKSEFSLDAE